MSRRMASCCGAICRPSSRPTMINLHRRIAQTQLQLTTPINRYYTKVVPIVLQQYNVRHFTTLSWRHNFTQSCAYSSKTTGKKEEKSPFLLAAVYGSFLIGGFLLLAILLREYKRKKLEWRGIFLLKVPEYKRMPIYTYKDFTIPDFVVKNIDDIESFQTDESDVWVVSFPRSGTTWLQEIVYLIQTDLDYYKARTEYLDDRFPYFEYIYPGVKEVQKMEPPRLIKSHLPWPLMPDSVKEKKPKIIYIARNPKDVLVSFYYFTRLLSPITKYKGSFQQYFNLFMEDKVMYSPWWKHVLQYWQMRNDSNVLYLTYEDLKKDTMGAIEKIADFLGKRLSEEQKFQLMVHCSFTAMKANEMTNHRWFERFGVSDPKEGECMRKGCIGDWANHFTAQMNKRMLEMLEDKLQDSGLAFTYSGTHFTSGDQSNTDTDNQQPKQV